MVRYIICLVVAVLLPNVVVLQDPAVLDPYTKTWLRTILNGDTKNRFGVNKPGTAVADNVTFVNWLQQFKPTETSLVTDTVTKSNAENTSIANIREPDPNQQLTGAHGIDKKTLEWLKKLTDATPVTETVTKSTIADTNKALNKFGSNITEPDLDQDFSDSTTCDTPDGEEGLCIPYFQCDSQGLIDNTTLIDLREKTCPHYLMKCCLRSEAHKKPKKIDVPTNRQCGWGNPGANIFRTKNNNINRITYADFGEFPWMVALIRKGGAKENWSQKHYLGGGSIIHPSVVITATHKVDKYLPEEIKCRAGEWDTQTDLELYPHQERDVRKIITHEEYYRTPAYNDVSLLILEKPYELQDAPHIGVACLAPQLPTPGTQCFSMGWGKEFQQRDKYAVILKKVQLPYVPSDQCEAALRRSRFTNRFTLHQSHICAGGMAGIDTCKGDGGSSLVCPIKEGAADVQYAVYGMVAFGVDCGAPFPAIYVNVPHLYTWVDNKMIAEGFDPSSYKY